MKKIGIVVPVYNAEMFLERCITSVLNQTYQNIELVLVDDGSTDNSGKICDDYAKKDGKVHVIHQNNHWRPSTTHFPLVCSVVIIKTYPFIQIRL